MTDNLTDAQLKSWLKLLVDVSQEFSNTLEIDAVLAKVLTMTKAVMQASEGSIFVLNDSGHVIKSIIAREELPPEVKTPTIDKVMQEGVAGWVQTNRDFLVIEDTKNDNRWRELPGDRLMTRSAIGAPIMKGDDLIGIMTLTDSEANKFNESFVTYLRPITDQAANAIENALVYTKTKGEWVALQRILHAVQAPILVCNRKDEIILFNPAASEALNITAGDKNKPLSEVVHEEVLLAFYNEDPSADQQQKELTFKNNRIFDGFITLLPGIGRIVSLHDITVLRKLMQLVNDWAD